MSTPMMKPPTTSTASTPITSCPATIAALSSQTDSGGSSTPKTLVEKPYSRVSKTCQVCQKNFMGFASAKPICSRKCLKAMREGEKTVVCQTCQNPFVKKYLSLKNRYCSKECRRQAQVGVELPKKPLSERKGTLFNCAVCGTPKWYPNAWLKKVKTPTCSKQCNGVLRGQDWAKHGHKGAAAVSAEGRASAIRKMTGEGNPAWKGGVTIFKKKGNYKDVRYIRCPTEFLPMARKDGYVMEHRLIVAKVLGRCLERAEAVHHMNHNPVDNREENLALFSTNRDHKLYEHHGLPLPVWQGSNPSTTQASSGA